MQIVVLADGTPHRADRPVRCLAQGRGGVPGDDLELELRRRLIVVLDLLALDDIAVGGEGILLVLC
jgi:hypothetical protein